MLLSRRGRGEAEDGQRGRVNMASIYAAVSSVKHGSFLCTHVAQKKMQQKGKRKHRKSSLEGLKSHHTWASSRSCSLCSIYPITFLLKKMLFTIVNAALNCEMRQGWTFRWKESTLLLQQLSSDRWGRGRAQEPTALHPEEPASEQRGWSIPF